MVRPPTTSFWRLLVWAWMLLLASTLLNLAQAADDAPGRVARIAEVQGQGNWIQDEPDGEWFEAELNRPLTGGTRIQVAPDGRLELRVGSTSLRLAGGSVMQLHRLDDDRIELELLDGSAALRVRSPEVASEITLFTAEGRFLPRRPGHYRIDHRSDTSFATAWSGELRFEANDSSLVVAPGRRAEFWLDPSDRRTHYTWSESERDAFSDWVARDNRDDDRGPAQRYVSPEMTGWEDLDRHGRWENSGEFGTVWIPTVVAADWAPYRHGRWIWMRPWGWTWVDEAPWGFAPFHYGRWVNWQGRWCWTPPTERVPRPVYAPALVAWVGGPSVSLNLRIGGGQPMVGWVPLAPREVYRPAYRVNPIQLRHLNAFGGPPRQPAGSSVYLNLRVPGGATLVAQDVFAGRRPVAPAYTRVDDDGLRALWRDRGGHHAEPPPRLPLPPGTPRFERPWPGAQQPLPRAPVTREPPPTMRPGSDGERLPPRPTERVPLRPGAVQVMPQAERVPVAPPARERVPAPTAVERAPTPQVPLERSPRTGRPERPPAPPVPAALPAPPAAVAPAVLPPAPAATPRAPGPAAAPAASPAVERERRGREAERERDRDREPPERERARVPGSRENLR